MADGTTLLHLSPNFALHTMHWMHHSSPQFFISHISHTSKQACPLTFMPADSYYCKQRIRVKLMAVPYQPSQCSHSLCVCPFLQHSFSSQASNQDFSPKNVILSQDLQVQQFTLDFESACWRALAEVFPEATLHGCVFHWKQAVWRHIQEAGLQTAYNQKNATFKLLSQLMALPYLPSLAIPTVFRAMKMKVEANENLKRVCWPLFNFSLKVRL